MWGYYGSKSKVVNLYPSPTRTKIIEPFAGTAQYSLKYFDRDIVLLDKYSLIVDLWKWLQKCSPNDILSLPRLKYGESTDDFTFDCIEAKWLVGFIIVGAPTQPKKTASRWKTIIRPNTQEYKLKYIADNLYKIKHWDVRHGDYSDLVNVDATWFIDPPYSIGGQHYRYSSKHINFQNLANWSKSRNGQVIVCENQNGDWLPFKHLSEMRGAAKNSTEMIWTNEDARQLNQPLTK